MLSNALNTIEANFPASPAGVFIASVSYGLPDFNWLPRSVVQGNLPRLLSDLSRFVLEEAPAFPRDVVGDFVGGSGAIIPKKDRFNVNIVIETNDILFELQSDSVVN
jgi:hypothetical protein